MAFAVIDRFEEDKAVLLVGENERKVIFPSTELPEGLQEGDYIQLEIRYDAERTEAARKEAELLLQDLQQDE